MPTPKTTGPTLDRLHVLDESGRRQYIYPADVHGRFTRIRPWVFAVLIAIYVLLPWIKVDGRPAVFIDIPGRHFYLFGQAFNAQDFYLVFFFVTGVGFALIVCAALLGRVFCGWACPQTVFLEGVFRPIERLIEGPAARRRELARGPWTFEKLWRKTLKHAIYLVLSFLLAHVFLAYFVSLPELFRMVKGSPLAHFTTFLWAFALTAVIYLNFFWFREQLCLIVCPYGRLQSALQDPDTWVIGYDRRRGEPRGKVHDTSAGDCVDCRRCVAVCPTGIDIRNGLQMECVGCARCIDACDDIMVRLSRPRGLIRYDSERGLGGAPRRFIFGRPRLIGYLIAGIVGFGVLTATWMRHTPFEANVVRGRGAPYVIEDGTVTNQFLLHLINKSPVKTTLTLEATAAPPAVFIIPKSEVPIEPQASMVLPIIVSLPASAYHSGLAFSLRIREQASGNERQLTLPFTGPASGLKSGAGLP